MAVAMIGPKFYAWDRNGNPLAGGKVFTYQARTNVPKATYQSEDAVTENTNPVILNTEGYADIYLDGSYKIVVKDSGDNEIWTEDPVTAASAEEWVFCQSINYLSPTSFTIAGNVTDRYSPLRRIRIDNGGSFVYSTIESSNYGGGNTTIVIVDSVIDTTPVGACVSIIDYKSLNLSPFIGGGADDLLTNGSIRVPSVSVLRTTEPLIDGQQISVLGHTDAGIGGGVFWHDAADTTSADDNYDIFVTPGGKRWKRSLRVNDSSSTQDFGPSADIGVEINTILNDNKNASIAKGSHSLATPIVIFGKRNIFGAGNHLAGSVVTLSGDNSFINAVGTPITRNRVKGIFVDGDAQTTATAINLTECYLFQFDEVWLKSCFKGVSISLSDSVVFNGLRVMETSKDYAVEVGDGCTNIIFNYSNFETGNEGFVNGGKIKIDSTAHRVSTVDLNSCQFERSGADVVNGVMRMLGGKVGDRSSIVLKSGAFNCIIDSTFSTGSGVQDFGFNNTIKNAYSRNMSTPEHKWPTPVSVGAGTTPTFGAGGDEWLFLAAARAKGSVAVTGGTIEFKDGAVVLDTSPAFNLFASGVSIGQEDRPIYAYVTAVKTTTNPIEVDAVGAQTSFAGIRGGKCLNANATFDGGTSTGWSFVDAAGAASGNDLLVTPTNATWGIYQNITSLLSIGKKYIAVIKYNGPDTGISLTLGNPWDGSDGERNVFGEPVLDLYGDGDNVQMISFEYLGQSTNLSFGSILDSSPVTLKYFALIEA